MVVQVAGCVEGPRSLDATLFGRRRWRGRPLPAAYSCGRGAFRAAAGQAKPGEISLADAAPGTATVQGGGHSARQQDGARRLGVVGQRRALPGAAACGSVRRGSQREDEVASVRLRTARGDEDVDAKRSRPSIGKPANVPREQRARAIDWDRSADHIRARSQNGCIQRPNTWLHPYRFAKGQILFPCTAGAVHTWHWADDPACPRSRRILEG